MKKNKALLLCGIMQFFVITHITALSFHDFISKISLDKTQSGVHARAYKNKILRFFSHINWNKSLIKIVDNIYKRELIETKNGNYIFFHGRRWKWEFLSDIFKKLWEMKNNKKVRNNFQFLRFENNKQAFKDIEIKKRQNALIGKETSETGFVERLFMNHALFGYVGNKGRCSFSYMLDNSDKSSVCISIIDLFKHFNMETLYTKYEKKLKKLYNLHKCSSKHGSLLLISCTPEQVAKSVLPVHRGLGKRKAIIVNGKKTYNPKIIIDALKINPRVIESCNKVKYGLLLTHDCALAPSNGPSIYSFYAVDENRFKKYKKLKKKIFENIAKDISICEGV